MANSINPKMKILYLMKILLEKTDENNQLTMSELIDNLSAYGISAERKSIYTDLELLRQFGLDIIMVKSKSTGYAVASREFELPELKLLVDAVQSSQLITLKKSDELIKKLTSLTSAHQAKQLKRQLLLADKPKSINESVYYNVDAVHNAINDGLKIKFKYFDYDLDKKRIHRREGEFYTQTPVALCWNDDRYYLICFNNKREKLIHFRVDRMGEVAVSSEKADKYDKKVFNVNDHIKQVFGMYGGEVVRATLRFDNRLINTVIDRFGSDVTIRKRGEAFDINVYVSESPVFLSWIAQFGKEVEIIGPESLRNRIIEFVNELCEIYKL